MGKGKEDGRKTSGKPGEMNTIHLDCAFIGGKQSDGEKLIPVLVAVDEESKMHLAAVVPKKGSTGEYAVRRIIEFLRDVGLESMLVAFKSDQEAAIRALLEEVRKSRVGMQTVIEESPVGIPQTMAEQNEQRRPSRVKLGQ